MTIKELKKLMEEYQSEAVAEIPQLEKKANDVGSCWENEQLGFSKGYARALGDILKKI